MGTVIGMGVEKKKKGNEGGSCSGKEIKELKAEIKQLKAENEKMQTELEILKKASAEV